MTLTAKDIFEDKIANKIKEDPDKATSINAIYEFQLSGEEGGTWTLDLKQEGGKITEGSLGNADCTVTISLDDLSDIVEKKLNPQMAFMSGKLKVTGDMGLALKLGTIL